MKEKEKTLKSKKKLLPLVLLFLLLFALIIYLKLNTQKDISKRSSDVNQKADQVEITSFEDRLPDNYPEDIPVYGQAEIVNASASDTSVSVMWRTEDLVEEVKNYYDLALKENGWEYELSKTDEAVMYKLNKNEKTGFMVIANEDGITTITIAVGLE
jgi:hypothetical protein